MANSAPKERRRLFDDPFIARLEQLHLIAKRLTDRGTSPGQRRSRRLGDGLEFADHRDYTPGDDVRYIDWPYFGRMGKLLLRMFHQHSESVVTILLDASGSMGLGESPGKFDYARRAAGALAYVAMGGLERVNLRTFAEGLGDQFAAGRNRGQILQVLDWLAGLAPGGQTQLLAATEQISRSQPRGAAVLVLSDLLGCQEQLGQSLARLRSVGHDVAVLHIISPADSEPPAAGGVLLEEIETQQRQSITITPSVAESYRRVWAKFCTGCQAVCTSGGATYVAARTDQPLDRLILQTLRKAGIVGPG